MSLFRKALFGAALYGAWKYVKARGPAEFRATHDGISAVFPTREQADLAIEHLVQAYRVDRTFIFVEPVGDENTAGTAVSGGDHASGEAGSHDRSDSPLNGAIEVTVPLGQANRAQLTRALEEAGGTQVHAF